MFAAGVSGLSMKCGGSGHGETCIDMVTTASCPWLVFICNGSGDSLYSIFRV